jgi:predicted secreted protein
MIPKTWKSALVLSPPFHRVSSRVGGGETTGLRQLVSIAAAVGLVLSLLAAGVAPAGAQPADATAQEDLDLTVELASEMVLLSDAVTVEVSANDYSGANVTVRFYETDSETPVYDTQTQLDGNGEQTVEVPATELNGTGEYAIRAEHEETGTQSERAFVSVIDEETLDFTAAPSGETFHTNTEVRIEASAYGPTGSNVSVVFYEQNDNVPIAAASGVLDGTGEASVTADPTELLNGTGNYTAVAEHGPTGATTEPVEFSVIDGYADVSGEEPVQLPATDGLSISGPTSFEAGTGLEVAIIAGPSGESSLYRLLEPTVESSDGDSNTWSATVDLGDVENETDILIKIDRKDVVGQVTPDGSAIDGVVVPGTCLDVGDNGNCAGDTAGDGLLNDIDGDGEFTVSDVRLFFEHRNDETVQNNVDKFDFDGDGEITISDVRALYDALSKN